ncbi:hypothetical protein [Pseudonocardia endophytica]|uniref:Uncharacterized protein n=1 Tax=Pseudonocardia endophytica TaxID=401976 RepID=A0A4R1HV32_PSEEN|nr:hypothetical protein [Pseudonocardia endophytica]TCK26594.1 hypothetical protein EV378_2432 [Pseudonocardia endophytica]
MAADGSVLTGVLLFAAIAFGPAVGLWTLLRLPRVVRWVWERVRPEPAPRPSGLPLESLVADLRRLHREICGPAPPTRVRRTALLAAYDDVLLSVCRAVGVSDPPLGAAVAAGGTAGALDPDRGLARLRAEAAVQEAGIALDPPAAA